METLVFDYHQQYGVKVKVARIFNTYGPKMDPEDDRVVLRKSVTKLAEKELGLRSEVMPDEWLGKTIKYFQRIAGGGR